MIFFFEFLFIFFDEISYFVDMFFEMKNEGMIEMRLKLFNNIIGFFRFGVLIVLVGVSGVGKIIFMDVLVGWKIGGYIEGEIRIVGYFKV